MSRLKEIVESLANESLLDLVPYPPGKPIEEVERELGISGSIKLASNENPVGPSPKAVEAIRKTLAGLNRYPDGSAFYLKRRLSEKFSIPPESIAVGNGSNELIELVARAFLRPGDEAVMAVPSFAVYPIIVKAAGAISVQVPLREFVHDLPAMAEVVGPKTKLVFIANPNNPTGTAVTEAEVNAFLEAVSPNAVIVFDEAYYEYVTDPRFPYSLKHLSMERPILLLRTFSKIYGLAGLRIGYGFGAPELVEILERVRQPFNVNSTALAAGLAALDDEAHVKRSRRNNTEGLAYITAEMEALGLRVVPSQANFVLVEVGESAQKIFASLLREGIIVRSMAGFGLNGFIRVTVGLPEENKRFVESLEKVLALRSSGHG